MSVTTSRLLIYIALIALIFTLIYVKNKNMKSQTEYFTDTAFKVKVVSGNNISISQIEIGFVPRKIFASKNN